MRDWRWGIVVLGVLLVPACRDSGYQVDTVIDGDTIRVWVGQDSQAIRYIGMDTPESNECFGPEAGHRNRLLLRAGRVRLSTQVAETDRYGRWLRDVWVGQDLLAAILVAEGYARVLTMPPNDWYAPLLERLEAEAWAQRRGLWGACP